ncbi:thymidine kinase [Gynuella sunshinyii]|uniref:Thymidine kinase n=1 Tax=Gynuella sunshinyii YC6258 TaxID=1445510 RepID=A0A0C5V8V9_9GAMM|nr:thymidine kinase [Gynuella sunshinyii]AJQ95780.1 thymidine kinase [Gynuella sunshinyii YC6258]DAC80057.1 TPA_exp: thymidine kinase [Gynuella sunshinyii YC6258]
MAQLYFYYSAMNAGKSTSLLQSAYNYRERGMQVLLYTAAIDDRFGKGRICSRIGLESEALTFGDQDLYQEIQAMINRGEQYACILIDEAQFLSKVQVDQLARIVDLHDMPVLCYGIRTDFMGELFPGSERLLAIADKISELKTICYCGRKASMVVRMDQNGNAIAEGEQIVIGGNESYVSMCRKHYMEAVGRY